MVSPNSATPIDGRVLIFDADGVLIQPSGFANVLQHSYGISRNVTHSFFSGPFQACLKGKAALEDVLPPYLDAWGWAESTGQFIELWLDADNNPAVHVFRAIDAVRQPKDVCCVASRAQKAGDAASTDASH